MKIMYKEVNEQVHRLIPSRFPPVSLFDWAESMEELEQIAALEGLTNDRLKSEYGNIRAVALDDWIGGIGSTPLMAAFTHAGESRFCDGMFGVYYAADSLNAAIAETKYHRERFLKASNEPPCLIQMREYINKVTKPLVDICAEHYQHLLSPNPEDYSVSQTFGRELRQQREYGLYYPSVRHASDHCIAIFRPPALSIPQQAGHFDYIWDGQTITQIRKSELLIAMV